VRFRAEEGLADLCGLERVRVYNASGVPTRDGRGLFAAALVERFPTLPVEEEGRLVDPRLRENVIECIFAYRDLLRLFTDRWMMGDLRRSMKRERPTRSFRALPRAASIRVGRMRSIAMKSRSRWGSRDRRSKEGFHHESETSLARSVE